MNQDRLKVAVLAPYLHGTGGGSDMHIKKIIKYLSHRDDIDLHILSMVGYSMSSRNGHFKVHEIKRLFYPMSLPAIVASLYRKTVEINPDVIHAIGTFPPYSTAAVFLRKRYPTVLTIMGLTMKDVDYIKGLRHVFTRFIKKPNEKYVVSKIPNIIIQSPYIKKLIDPMTGSKIYIVPEGIEFQEIQSIKSGDVDADIDIFIAVRLWKLKGMDILIKAIPKVKEFVPDVKVHIAGSGEEEENLKNLVRSLGVEKNVTFMGYISDEDTINKYYKASKIVVVPSRWDVDPFAPLNAAASSKPAIVSDMCNSCLIEDGKNGFIFKSEAVDELSGKIIKLLTDDKLRSDMGKNAWTKGKEYDWREIVNKNINIYRDAITSFIRENKYN